MADEWPRVLCRLGISGDMVSERQLLEQRRGRTGTRDRHKGVGLRFHRDAGIKNAVVWALFVMIAVIRHEDEAKAD